MEASSRKVGRVFRDLDALRGVGAEVREWETPTGKKIRRERQSVSAEANGGVALEYDVTTIAGLVTLDTEKYVYDVQCDAGGAWLEIVTTAPDVVLAWEKGTPLTAGAHFSCGKAMAAVVTASHAKDGDGKDGPLATVVLNVSQISVLDVFEEAKVAFHAHPVTAHPQRTGQRTREVYTSPVAELLNFNYDPNTQGPVQQRLTSGSLTCFECYASIEAGLQFELDVSAYWVNKMDVRVVGSAVVNGDVAVENPSLETDTSVPLTDAVQGSTFTFLLAGVPIDITPELELRAEVKSLGSTVGRVTSGLSASASASLGVAFENGEWGPVSSTEWTVEVREPQFFFAADADSSFKMFIVPRITFQLWSSTVGIVVDTKLFAGVNLRTSASLVADPMSLIDNGPLKVPGPVSSVSKFSSTLSTLGLEWNPPAHEQDVQDASRYRVDYYECGALICSLTANPWINFPTEFSDTFGTVTGLSGNTWYGFRVRSGSLAGWGGYSDVVQAKTTDSPAPPPSPTPSPTPSPPSPPSPPSSPPPPPPSPPAVSFILPTAGSSYQTGLTAAEASSFVTQWAASGFPTGYTFRVEVWQKYSLYPDSKRATLLTGTPAVSNSYSTWFSSGWSTGSNYYVYIVDEQTETYSALSPLFTIVDVLGPPSLSVTAPTSGQVIPLGDPIRVEWSISGVTYNTVTIQVAVDVFGPDSPATVTTTAPMDEPYTFTLDASWTPSTFYYVTVTFNGPSGVSDSMLYFTVTASSGASSGDQAVIATSENDDVQPLTPTVSTRAPPSCSAGDTSMQLYLGAAVSLSITDVQVPDSVAIIGGYTLFTGGPIGTFDLTSTREATCASCSACRSDLQASSAWVSPQDQRGALPPPSAPGEEKSNVGLAVGLSFFFIVLVGLGLGLAFFFWRRNNRAQNAPEPPHPPPSAPSSDIDLPSLSKSEISSPPPFSDVIPVAVPVESPVA